MGDESVTHWITQLKAGDELAASKLWNRYVEALIRLAWKKLRNTPRQVADENDVVQMAFDHFLRGVQTNRFRKLNDRHDLWQILVMLTDRRATDKKRRDATQRKYLPVLRVSEEAISSAQSVALGGVAGGEPTPEFAAEATEACRTLLEMLPDEETRMVAIWKMEGYLNREIAGKLGVVERTVGRRLAEIREIWSSRLEGHDDDSAA